MAYWSYRENKLEVPDARSESKTNTATSTPCPSEGHTADPGAGVWVGSRCSGEREVSAELLQPFTVQEPSHRTASFERFMRSKK